MLEKINGDKYVGSFMEKHANLIDKLGHRTYNNTSNVSTSAFRSVVKIALNKAYISFITKNKDLNYLDRYLHGTLRRANQNILDENKDTILVCPGCIFNGQISQIIYNDSKLLTCTKCLNELNNADNDDSKLLHSTFAIRSYSGSRCPNCTKFIPNISSLLSNKSDNIKCPYYGCKFSGKTSFLTRMANPTIKSNKSPIDTLSIKSDISDDIDKISAQEELGIAYDIIINCIDEQIKTLHNKCHSSTFMNKLCMYKAFKSSINKFPEEMISYFSNTGKVSGAGNIQARIFQEFSFHLEKSLPHTYTSNKETFTVSSLLDESLNVFDGESVFTSEVNDKQEIPNLTNEMYIGSRGASYCLPFYIGKVIDIIDLETNQSISNHINEYSCTKILMLKSIKPGTKVKVTHLRVVPHYQSGGFTHLNRLKKSLCEKIKIALKK